MQRPTCNTFLAYIQHEIYTTALRKKRRPLVQTVALPCVERICMMYRRALQLYPMKLSLWFSYFAYCQRSKSFDHLKQAIKAAVKLHHTEADMWLCAARNAWENNEDSDSARHFLHRGLQELPGSADLRAYVQFLNRGTWKKNNIGNEPHDRNMHLLYLHRPLKHLN